MSFKESASEQYTSPDGLLRLCVSRGVDGDVGIGFDGFPWHTHADILAAMAGLPEKEAVRVFVNEVLSSRRVLVLWSVKGELKDVWVSDDPTKDAGYANGPHAAPGELVVLRYWDGRNWNAEQSLAAESR